MATLSTPTLQQLLTSVRTLLNQPRESNSFWKDVELTEYLNEAVRIYFLECTLVDEGYFTTVTNLDIVANTETIALPTDCFQVKNVWKKVNNGYINLPYKNNLTEGYSTQGGTASDTYQPCYEFQGNNLVLRPTPNFSETAGIRMQYLQFPDQMVWGGDSMTSAISPLFKQLIVIYAVYKAKLRESMVNNVNTYAVPKMNLEELYKLFKDTISRRSKNPTYVVPFSPDSDGA
jgi:hypothetical protein